MTDGALKQVLRVIERERASVIDSCCIKTRRGRAILSTLEGCDRRDVEEFDTCIRYILTELKIRSLRRRRISKRKVRK